MSLAKRQLDALATPDRGEHSAASPPPPSLRPGRDGLLRLGFERRADATILRRCRYTLPLQALSPLTLDGGTCYLLMLNPTGGVLGGDHLHTEIALAEGARVCLSTPSATRVYRANGGSAEVHTHIRISRNATLEYLPDHLIPHPGASLRQSLHVEMDAGSRGIFFDGFACGRAALSEAWQFRDFDSHTEVCYDGRPIFANRTKIAGTQRFRPSEPQFRHADAGGKGAPAPEENSSNTSALKPMGGHAYSGSLLVVAGQFDDWRGLIEAFRSALDSIPGMLGGASALAHSGCSVRYLAHSAIEFQTATERLWTLARLHLLGLPPLSLRKY